MINQIKDTKIQSQVLEFELFEQYQDIRVNLGISASYDDLRTNSSATDALKNKVEILVKLLGIITFHLIKEIDLLTLQMDQYLL